MCLNLNKQSQQFVWSKWKNWVFSKSSELLGGRYAAKERKSLEAKKQCRCQCLSKIKHSKMRIKGLRMRGDAVGSSLKLRCSAIAS